MAAVENKINLLKLDANNDGDAVGAKSSALEKPALLRKKQPPNNPDSKGIYAEDILQRRTKRESFYGETCDFIG